MAKCLRCGATEEWILGKAPTEPVPLEVEELQSALADLYGEISVWFLEYDVKINPSMRNAMLNAKRALIHSVTLLPRKDPKRAT